MLICRRDRNGMNQAAACIHTDVAFHPEFPLIALFRLMHFRVTLLLRVFRRTGGIDDGRIHNGSALHHVPGLHHYPVDRVKKQLVQAVRFQKMTELAQRCFIRHCFRHKVNACEFSHGIAVVDGIFGRWVRQIEPDLKQVHPQHLFDPHGRTTALSLGVVGFNHANPFIPRDDLLHDFQKFLPLRFLLAVAVFDVCKCFLFHFLAPPSF